MRQIGQFKRKAPGPENSFKRRHVGPGTDNPGQESVFLADLQPDTVPGLMVRVMLGAFEQESNTFFLSGSRLYAPCEVGKHFFVALSANLNQFFVDPGGSWCVPVNQVDHRIDNVEVILVVQNSLPTGVSAVNFFPEMNIGFNNRVKRELCTGLCLRTGCENGCKKEQAEKYYFYSRGH